MFCFLLSNYVFSSSSDPILLFEKSRERTLVNGEGGHEAARAGSVLAGGDSVQRQRRFEARQGSTRGRGLVGACVVTRPHRRASGVRPLPSRRLRRAAERHGGEAATRAGQRARARVCPTRRGAFALLRDLAADVARAEMSEKQQQQQRGGGMSFAE